MHASEWLSANRQTFNKTKVLIGSRQRIRTFNWHIPVKRVSHTKSLGMYIDQHWSWSVHIDNLCKKVASGIGALKRISSRLLFSSLGWLWCHPGW